MRKPPDAGPVYSQISLMGLFDVGSTSPPCGSWSEDASTVLGGRYKEVRVPMPSALSPHAWLWYDVSTSHRR